MERVRLCLPRLALEVQPADLRQSLERLRADAIPPLADPDGVFAELDLLCRNAAKDHDAEPAIASGRRLAPSLRGIQYQSTGSAAEIATGAARLKKIRNRRMRYA